MPKSKQQKALSILIITALAVAVGCGDGKKGRRNKITRPLAKTGATTGGDAKTGLNVPGNTGGGKAPAIPGAADTKAKAEKEQRIAAIWKSLQADGKSINVRDLEDGTYTFDGSASALQVRPKTDWVQAIQVFQLDPNSRALVGTAEGEGAGLLTNDSDPGRTVELPGKFKVEGGQVKADVSWLYKTQMVQENVKTGPAMKDEVTAVSGRPMSNLINMMAGQLTDVNGKKLTLDVMKLNDGRVRFFISVDEVLPDANSNKARMTRQFALTYKFEKAAGAQTSAAKGGQSTAAEAPEAAASGDAQALPVDND